MIAARWRIPVRRRAALSLLRHIWHAVGTKRVRQRSSEATSRLSRSMVPIATPETEAMGSATAVATTDYCRIQHKSEMMTNDVTMAGQMQKKEPI